jgi:hypothetical protein
MRACCLAEGDSRIGQRIKDSNRKTRLKIAVVVRSEVGILASGSERRAAS